MLKNFFYQKSFDFAQKKNFQHYMLHAILYYVAFNAINVPLTAYKRM